MKKYILSSLVVLSVATLFTACNDMLDTDPRVTELTAATFPGKPGDVEALNAATYSIMNTLGGGDQSGILNNPFYWWSLMSDDCYGSGGLQDNVAKSLHHFTTASANQYEQDFILLYGGISRANNQIETIDNVEWTEAQKSQRNQLLGEGYFMRGFYTLLLTQLYGDVPLITSTVITDEMRQEVSAEEFIYPQILSDFVSAKTLMKPERANGSGHADKFAAAYKKILESGVRLSSNREASMDILYCATRKDIPQLKELRRRALYRQSDECFYDYKGLTRIIHMVLACAPELERDKQ